MYWVIIMIGDVLDYNHDWWWCVGMTIMIGDDVLELCLTYNDCFNAQLFST